MKAGNKTYLNVSDLPETVPIFPLTGALLLPGGQMPLNIFEPRYLAMIDDALAGDRLIAMIQPGFENQYQRDDHGADDAHKGTGLCDVGCLGRITAWQETGDGRYVVSLNGICRYRLVEEVEASGDYRNAKIAVFLDDLAHEDEGGDVDRDALLETFRNYLKANDMEADWDSVSKAGNETLVTALCMMSPYGPAEKQALLEAPDLKSRAETLIALTEIALARDGDGATSVLQ